MPPEQLDRARPAVTVTRISQWESASRSLVAEMMILTGEAVGTVGERGFFAVFGSSCPVFGPE